MIILDIYCKYLIQQKGDRNTKLKMPTDADVEIGDVYKKVKYINFWLYAIIIFTIVILLSNFMMHKNIVKQNVVSVSGGTSPSG